MLYFVSYVQKLFAYSPLLMNENLILRNAPEYWCDVNGYEGIYQVSNLGNVRSLDRVITRKNGKKLAIKGQLMKLHLDHRGYLRLNLRHLGKDKNSKIHRLVAQAFLPNPHNKPQVNHLNGDKLDNNVCNLEWCTQNENIEHAFANGLMRVGEKHGNSRLSSDQVVSIKQLLKQRENSITDIARKFNVGISTIHDIKSGKQWKSVESIRRLSVA